MNGTPLRVYIGLDRRFGFPAAHVTAASLVEHASIPVAVTYLDLGWLRRIGLYTRPMYETAGHDWNQQHDGIDGKPFSTEFSFSRFLVPSLQPDHWAIFCDSDFLWRKDIAELVSKLDDAYAVQCVQHEYQPAETTKMLGQAQQVYRRKNWSSLMAFNCGHPALNVLTPELVNRMPGSWLHGFEWLQDPYLGSLPFAWNWLEGWDNKTTDPACVHYTRGTPDMEGYESAPFAAEWLHYYRDLGYGDNELQHAENVGL